MKTRRLFVRAIFFTLFLAGCAYGQASPSAHLALTPPMGWNSWNKFGCNVSEAMIKEMADAVVKSGMRDAGYIYVNIDDCWQVSSAFRTG
jgi:alpha-galactosidase